jgi:hypothetical protein
LGRIKDIAFRAYFPYVETIGARPALLDENYLEKIEDGTLHVLLVNNEIVGFIIVYLVDDSLLIENVAVREVDGIEYRYLGNGRKATGSEDGWTMSQNLYFRCAACGYMMNADPYTDDSCTCGKPTRDGGVGRFGSRLGDDAVVYCRA